jgi:hypothetical protein
MERLACMIAASACNGHRSFAAAPNAARSTPALRAAELHFPAWTRLDLDSSGGFEPPMVQMNRSPPAVHVVYASASMILELAARGRRPARAGTQLANRQVRRGIR